jgi:dienelactone hydrolase
MRKEQMVKTCRIVAALILISCVAWSQKGRSQELNGEAVKIPMTIEGFLGKRDIQLSATVYRPVGKGPFPLVVLSHGSSDSEKEREICSMHWAVPQAGQFLKRGFAVIVLVRRGYGEAGGTYAEGFGSPAQPFYYEAGLESARDIIAAVKYGAGLPYDKGDTIFLVGQSGGGFGSIAAASLKPQGVVGVISFAGGRGGQPATNPGDPSCPEVLENAIARYAKTISVPVLWIYAENDS